MTGKLSLHFAGAFALAILPNICTAQPTLYRARVTITHVKPDMVNEWLDLQKNEVLPARKKGGVKTQTVLATSIFGSAYEYVTIMPFDSMADFDGRSPLVKALDAPGAARLGSKLNKCVESSNSYMISRMDDISNVTDPQPPVLVSVHYRIPQGKMDQYRALMKSDVLPVYKKAKVYLSVNQRGPGGNTNDVTQTTGYQKYADMNGGPFLTQQIGAAGAAQLNAKFTGVRNMIEVVVRRRIADLSF